MPGSSGGATWCEAGGRGRVWRAGTGYDTRQGRVYLRRAARGGAQRSPGPLGSGEVTSSQARIVALRDRMRHKLLDSGLEAARGGEQYLV